MQFIDLVVDAHFEIFRHLNPYSLSHLSRTSKHFRQIALTETLWKKHLENEFPYCTKKTRTAFEKYSAYKRKSLRHIKEPECRKLMVMVEAGHLEEIKIHLPLCKLDFFKLQKLTLKNKSLCLLLSEYPDPEIRDIFSNRMDQIEYWNYELDFYFGLFKKAHWINYDFKNTIEFGGVASLDYLYQQQEKDFILPHCLTLAAKCGSVEKIKWLLDHGDTISCNSIIDAVFFNNKEFLQYIIDNGEIPPYFIQSAIHIAVWHWKFDALKVLLSSTPQSELPLFRDFNFEKPTDETPGCLKLLLDSGVTINPSALLKACSHPRNESSIKILLEAGVTPKYTDSNGSTPLSSAINLRNIFVIKLLLKKGATATEEMMKRIKKMTKYKKHHST